MSIDKGVLGVQTTLKLKIIQFKNKYCELNVKYLRPEDESIFTRFSQVLYYNIFQMKN